MSLEQKINTEIKQAMLAKDSKRLEALRAIKAALLLAKTGKDISGGEIPESVEMQTLKRLVKQRKESADIYKQNGRDELAEEELYQAGIIEGFLPEQVSESEIEAAVAAAISETGAQDMKDMGRIMGMMVKKFAGKADNKMISEIVKKKLSS
jgi:uncharacterized protein YqeY